MKQVTKILTGLLCLILAVSLFMIGRQACDSRKSRQARDEAARLAGLTEERQAAEAEEVKKIPEEALDLASIDLESLREVSGDVAGWIAIPGTEVSYPLMQGEDNQYYLSHTWQGDTSKSGSVFLEAANSRDLTDLHTIVYGHRMRNNTMFGSIKYYKDLDYWQAHPNVYVVPGDGRILRYEIFSAHQADVKGLVYRLDIEEAGLEEEFLRTCMEGSAIDTGITPEPGERILTLSTCTGTGYARRWVVHSVLRDEYILENDP